MSEPSYTHELPVTAAPTPIASELHEGSRMGGAAAATTVLASAAVWTTNSRLVVDRISYPRDSALGYADGHFVGKSMLRFVQPNAGAVLLAACELAITAGHVDTVPVTATTESGRRVSGHLLVLSLAPLPGLGFVLLVAPATPSPRAASSVPGSAVSKLERQLDVVRSMQGGGHATNGFRSGRRVSSRERAVVEILMTGDRVPAIAQTLHISQSTVRNHLASVFRKLNVNSQQELVTLLKEADDPPVGS